MLCSNQSTLCFYFLISKIEAIIETFTEWMQGWDKSPCIQMLSRACVSYLIRLPLTDSQIYCWVWGPWVWIPIRWILGWSLKIRMPPWSQNGLDHVWVNVMFHLRFSNPVREPDKVAAQRLLMNDSHQLGVGVLAWKVLPRGVQGCWGWARTQSLVLALCTS